MNILLSAFACQPGKGSEKGVGWNWALSLARAGHKVYVLTQLKNKTLIEKDQRHKEITFIYYDIPKLYHLRKNDIYFFVIRYMVWQYLSAKHIKNKHKNLHFDVIHHITYASFRFPSFLWILKKPLIFGPVGGGEKIPLSYRTHFSFKESVYEKIRDFANFLSKYNPLLKITFIKSSKIYVANKATLQYIPRKYRHKSYILSNAGINTGYQFNEEINKKCKYKLLYAGRILHWKGIEYLLEAFKELQYLNTYQLTIIGSGPHEKAIKIYSKELGVYNKIIWINWLNQSELFNHIKKNDVFIYPSLRDSGGMVVLEALNFGKPVICFNNGGPGEIVTAECGISIGIKSSNAFNAKYHICDSVIKLSDPTVYQIFSKNAKKRALEYTWEFKVKNIYNNLMINEESNNNI